jgi:predicted PurR-regulated permease PerM
MASKLFFQEDAVTTNESESASTEQKANIVMSEQKPNATVNQHDSSPATLSQPTSLFHNERLRPLLAIITVILAINFFRAASAVILPVIFAIFLIALFWPLLKRLQRVMPRGLAMVVTFLVLLLIIGLFIAAFWYSGTRIGAKSAEYTATFSNYATSLEQYGIDIPGLGSDGSSEQTLSNLITNFQGTGVRLFTTVVSVAGAFVLIIAYLMLGLLEVPAYRAKLKRIVPGDREEQWLSTIEQIAHDFQNYMIIRTGIGLLNGVLAWIGLWLLGVDFAFTWGLLTFLLNYIPTIGSIIATVPPPLFALVQFQDPVMALLTLLIVGGLQLVLGTYVDPLIEGHYLSPSPLIVLISVTFWGWIWGATGAFIAVPLTLLIILACRQYARTRWIAILLSDVDEQQGEQAQGEGQQENRRIASASGG